MYGPRLRGSSSLAGISVARTPLQLSNRTDRIRLFPLAAGAVFAAYLAISASGVAGAIVVAAATGFAVALVLLMRRTGSPVDLELAGRLATGALLLVPAAMTIWLSFNQGGF